MDNDPSTPADHAYDFVGSFMIHIKYDTNDITTGDIIKVGFKCIMNVGRIESQSQTGTTDVISPVIEFGIKMK